MNYPIYEVQSLKLALGPRFTLKIDNLRLTEGKLYTLTGPNGSGKSTFLSVLAFLLRPSAGQIRFEGQPVIWNKSSLVTLRRGVTLLHQSPYLFEGTVAKNIALGLRARSVAAEEIHRRVDQSLARLDLTRYRDHDAKSLSGGEAQRVALARALVLEPRVLLLDEPLSNLDEESTRILKRIIASLPAAGHTVIMSTHHPSELASELADTTEIALREGRLSKRAKRAQPIPEESQLPALPTPDPC